MPKVNVNGRNLHYLTVGHGPSVVMLHGFLGNLAVWHLQIVLELRSQFRMITYDLKGHGYSDVTPTGYSAGEMAEELKGLLDEFNIQRTCLVGHSFGADVCLYFAHKYPERVERIVAIEPGLAALVDQRKSKHWQGWEYWVAKLEEAGLQIPADKRTDLEVPAEPQPRDAAILRTGPRPAASPRASVEPHSQYDADERLRDDW